MIRMSIRAKGPLEALARMAGLMLVVGLAVWGFWKNSERNMERINARAGLSDEIHGLSPDQRAHAQAFITALRKDYGIEARVRISETPQAPPEADGKTLYIGLCPAQKAAVVQLPPLMAGTLGPDFIRTLTEEHFPFHYQPGKDWQKGLLLALDLMQSRLDSLKNQQGAAPPAQNATAATTNATHDSKETQK